MTNAKRHCQECGTWIYTYRQALNGFCSSHCELADRERRSGKQKPRLIMPDGTQYDIEGYRPPQKGESYIVHDSLASLGIAKKDWCDTPTTQCLIIKPIHFNNSNTKSVVNQKHKGV